MHFLGIYLFGSSLFALSELSHQFSFEVFLLILSDSKPPQVFKTLLSILADFNNVGIWMVSVLPLISSFSNHFFKTFGDYFKCTNFKRYHSHPHVPQFFFGFFLFVFFFFFFWFFRGFFFLQIASTSLSLFVFFYFHSVIRLNGKIYKMESSQWFPFSPSRT